MSAIPVVRKNPVRSDLAGVFRSRTPSLRHEDAAPDRGRRDPQSVSNHLAPPRLGDTDACAAAAARRLPANLGKAETVK